MTMRPLDGISDTNAILATEGKTAGVLPSYLNGRYGLHGMLPVTRRPGSEVFGTDTDRLCIPVVFFGKGSMMHRYLRRLRASSELPAPEDLAGQPEWGSEWVSKKRGEDGFAKMDALPAAAPCDQEMRLSS